MVGSDATKAMTDKGVPEPDRGIRRQFVSHFMNTLHDQLRRRTVAKIGEKRDMRWKVAAREPGLEV